MLKHFKIFFYPTVLTYSYNKPKEIVIAKITEVFNQKVTLFSSNDMTGKFLNKDTFAINTNSFANIQGVKYGSTLVGQIIDSKNVITEIRTKAKPNFILYTMFFVSLIVGLLYLFKFFQNNSTEFIFWSLALLFFGTVLPIGFSNVAIYSIRLRYKMYIHKALST